jgi:hypothetical protein
MQPLRLSNANDLDYTSRILGSGTVSAVDTTAVSFTLHATQYVAGGQNTDDIVVQACLAGNPKWANPANRIPHMGAIVSFCGVLQKFDNFILQGKKHVTCAVIALEDITYLYNPPAKPAKPSASLSLKGNLRDKIRARAETEQASQTSGTPELSDTHVEDPSSPSTSQTRLGKRKASSEDEVDDDV